MPDDFTTAFNGTLYSLMSWQQLADFWSGINPEAGWYLYAVGECVPACPSTPNQVKRFILEIDALLRRDHDEDYCGIVFANNLEAPTLVKIYDPHHLGTSCGSGKISPLPGWIMSLLPPSELKPGWVSPENRKRWWNALLAHQD